MKEIKERDGIQEDARKKDNVNIKRADGKPKEEWDKTKKIEVGNKIKKTDANTH